LTESRREANNRLASGLLLNGVFLKTEESFHHGDYSFWSFFRWSSSTKLMPVVLGLAGRPFNGELRVDDGIDKARRALRFP
jgi:hypothetical protein